MYVRMYVILSCACVRAYIRNCQCVSVLVCSSKCCDEGQGRGSVDQKAESKTNQGRAAGSQHPERLDIDSAYVSMHFNVLCIASGEWTVVTCILVSACIR